MNKNYITWYFGSECLLKARLNPLDIQIAAIPQEMKIRIAVPLEFITIEQTSA
jgi:hypothetical protein